MRLIEFHRSASGDSNQPLIASVAQPPGIRTMTSGLVALVGDAPHAWTMVNALRKRFGDFPVRLSFRNQQQDVFFLLGKR